MRRQAIKLCVRKGFSFQSSWWSVYRDVEHRTEHWMQLLTTANSSSDLAHTPSASAAVHNTEVAQLRREVDCLRQSGGDRTERRGSLRRRSPKQTRSSTGKTFDEILKDSTARTFMTANHQSGKVCWHFQRGTCTRDCKMLHECAGCGAAGIGYDACRCQASRELRVKKFLTLICCMAASLLFLVFLLHSPSAPSIPTK